MRCPKCGKAHTRVVDSRMQESNNTIKRRRECCSCNYRFTTFERCEDPIEVIKSDGSKQRFDRNKLLVGLMRATIKRDIDTKKLNEIIDDIEVELRSRTLTAVTSHELGDMCSSAWPRSTRWPTFALPRSIAISKTSTSFCKSSTS